MISFWRAERPPQSSLMVLSVDTFSMGCFNLWDINTLNKCTDLASIVIDPALPPALRTTGAGGGKVAGAPGVVVVVVAGGAVALELAAGGGGGACLEGTEEVLEGGEEGGGGEDFGLGEERIEGLSFDH